MSSNFHTMFEGLDPQDWKTLIEKELKGRPYENLQTETDCGITVQPFYTAEDLPSESPIVWEPFLRETMIGEYFDLRESHSLDNLKKSLNGGCNSPELRFAHSQQIKEVFSFLHPSFLYTMVSGDAALLEEIALVLSKKEGEKQGCAAVPFEEEPLFWETKKTFSKVLPNWQFGWIDGGEKGRTDEKLIAACHTFSLYLEKGLEQGYSLSHLAKGISIRWNTGNDFLLETVNIRALQTLLANLLEQKGLSHGCLPLLDVRPSENALTEDKHLNMIRLTTQAVIAHSARVDRLTLPASNYFDKEYRVFEKRISRNIHHLLLMEAGFDKSVDTLEGSYFFENLSLTLAKKIWDQL